MFGLTADLRRRGTGLLGYRTWSPPPDDASQPKHDIRARRSDYFAANAKHLDHFPESRHSGGGSGPD